MSRHCRSVNVAPSVTTYCMVSCGASSQHARSSFRGVSVGGRILMKRVLLLAVMFVFAVAGRASAAPPTPGAAGLGDRLFPELGNGGYDTQHYDVDLTYGAKYTDPIDGTVTILARATQALSRFDLDFAGRSVGSVSVNGAAAKFVRQGEELVITPRRAIDDGSLFIVTVAHFVAAPGEDPTGT